MLRRDLAAALAAMCFMSGHAMAQDSSVRLDPNATPERYELDITPDVAGMRFTGVEQIRVRLARPAATLTLNAADLTIATASADGRPARASLDGKAERLTLAFDRPLAAGEHRLAITYAGKINTTPRGLFAVSYKEDGRTRTALATQLESIDARRLLPCWDEPDHKATFAVSMVTPSGQLAVSNMPVASTRAAGAGLQRVSFAETPRMSPYLLFMGAGDFVRVTRKAGPVEIGLVSTRAVAAHADFTLTAAGELLPYYDRYFGAPYPLPKLDLFLMPGSGQPVGMENWGAVFGYEGGFIVDPKTATGGARAFVYLVIAHELAHQWFGDLVTLRWWDDTWLNEGFASWLQVKASGRFHPESNPSLQAQSARDGAMDLDATDASHPVITPVDDPGRLDAIFDQITYDKGQAVIAMLESWLGEAPFRQAISSYVRDHAYGSATSEDLWLALQRADPRARRVAEAFTGRPGVPLLQAQAGPCRDGRRDVRLTQSRLTGAGATAAPPWPIPLRLGQAGAQPQPVQVVETAKAKITLDGCAPVIVNAGQGAYARVAYDEAGFAELLAALGRLGPEDQMGLIDDQWALARAGIVGASRSLDLMAALGPGAAQPVWLEELSVMQGLDRLYQPGPARERLRAFERGVLRRAADASDAGQRQTLARRLAVYGEPQAVAAARADLETLLAGQPLPPAQRSVALDAGVAHADAALYDRLLAWARATTSTEDRSRMFGALAGVEDEALARRSLDLTLTDEVSSGVAVEMLLHLAELHGALVAGFVQDHAEAFSHKLRPVDLDQLKTATRPRVDTLSQQQTKAQIDAWLTAHAA